jgi:hypothetical protein
MIIIIIIIHTIIEELQKYTELKDELRIVRQLQAVCTVPLVGNCPHRILPQINYTTICNCSIFALLFNLIF